MTKVNKKVKKKVKKAVVKKTDAKKVDVKKTDATKVPMVPNKDGIPVPALSKQNLLEAELLLSKTEQFQAKSQNKHKEAELLEQKSILQVRALRHDALAFEQETRRILVERATFWDKMGKLYGIDFKHAGYDDQTGIITVDPRERK